MCGNWQEAAQKYSLDRLDLTKMNIDILRETVYHHFPKQGSAQNYDSTEGLR